MHPSDLLALLHTDTGLRSRVRALLVEHAWSLPDDDAFALAIRSVPETYLDAFMWHVATNATVQNKAMKSIEGGLAVDDGDLEFILWGDGQAWGRIDPEAAAPDTA